MITNLAIAAVAAVVLVATFLIGIRLWPKLKCPDCGERSIQRVDFGVLYDPAPKRVLLHCDNCDAEWVRLDDDKWVRRSDWHDPEDHKLWDDLNAEKVRPGRSKTPDRDSEDTRRVKGWMVLVVIFGGMGCAFAILHFAPFAGVRNAEIAMGMLVLTSVTGALIAKSAAP